MLAPMKFMLSGYYGFGNTGDEAILCALVKELRERFRQAELVVLSQSPEETARQHGVRAVNRWNLWRIERELQTATAWLSGGGGLIQDRTSRRSAFYYLGLMARAQRRCPVFVVGQGIGPIRSHLVRWASRRLFRRVEFAMARDERSREVLHDWGLREDRLMLGGDLTLLQWPQWQQEREAPILREDEELHVAVCLKGGLSKDLKTRLVQQLDRFSEAQGTALTFLALYPREDLSVAEEIAARLRRPARVLHAAAVGTGGLVESMRTANAVLSMRLHGLIFSLLAARPFIALGEDPKLDAFIGQVRWASGLDLPLWTPTQLARQNVDAVEALVSLCRDYEAKRSRLIHAGEALYQQTRRAIDALWQHLSHHTARSQ
jgi:polysaccharide pyruvyl transferase CsaB